MEDREQQVFFFFLNIFLLKFFLDLMCFYSLLFFLLKLGLAGRQGEQGDKGELVYPPDIKGNQGNVGDKGFPGYEGPIGPIGPAGPPGLDGLIGIKGEKVRFFSKLSQYYWASLHTNKLNKAAASILLLYIILSLLKRALTEKVVHQAGMVNQVETAYRVVEEKMPVLKMPSAEKTDSTVLRKNIHFVMM
jgi:hypothetical protein